MKLNNQEEALSRTKDLHSEINKNKWPDDKTDKLKITIWRPSKPIKRHKNTNPYFRYTDNPTAGPLCIYPYLN